MLLDVHLKTFDIHMSEYAICWSSRRTFNIECLVWGAGTRCSKVFTSVLTSPGTLLAGHQHLQKGDLYQGRNPFSSMQGLAVAGDGTCGVLTRNMNNGQRRVRRCKRHAIDRNRSGGSRLILAPKPEPGTWRFGWASKTRWPDIYPHPILVSSRMSA